MASAIAAASRSARASDQACFASLRAVASPMPEAAPATMASWPGAHFSANGLSGEPTAPVIRSGGATSWNS